MPTTEHVRLSRAYRRSSRAFVIAAAALGAAVVIVATVVGMSTQGQTPKARPLEAMNVYHPADAQFYERFAPGEGAMEVEHYDSVPQMAEFASVVLTGQVEEVRLTRIIIGEVASDRVPMVGVTIRPDEVLNGALPPEFRTAVTVEFVGIGNGEQLVEHLKSILPQGQAIWVLRSKADGATKVLRAFTDKGRTPSAAELASLEAEKPYYRLVSSQGLFIQGETHVVNPITEESEDRGAVEEAEVQDKLSGLAARMRKAA